MDKEKNKSLFEGKHGIILVNKAQNWTSHDCVGLIRRKTRIKRVGHTGTLDPMAMGVLPVCIGTAARIMDYTDWDWKEYVCRVKFGIKTDTGDIWGNIIASKDIPDITEKEIKKVLENFIGEIEQVPPKYSAIKVNGKKLYEYARNNEEVKIKSRKVKIKRITLENIFLSEDAEEKICGVELRVVCSKGTYIRTLCEDISENFGSLGTMSYLIRTASGEFHIEKAIDIEVLKNMSEEDILKKLLPTDFALAKFGKIELNLDRAKDFVNGKKTNLFKLKKLGEDISIKETACEECSQNLYRVYLKREFIGVGRLEKGILIADKVFNVSLQKS